MEAISRQAFQEKVNELHNNYKSDLKKLQMDFAKSNEKYSVGDVISDGETTIQISNIRYDFDNRFITTFNTKYEGLIMKKDGKPGKKEDFIGGHRTITLIKKA